MECARWHPVISAFECESCWTGKQCFFSPKIEVRGKIGCLLETTLGDVGSRKSTRSPSCIQKLKNNDNTRKTTKEENHNHSLVSIEHRSVHCDIICSKMKC
jgi:hypothetical protein